MAPKVLQRLVHFLHFNTIKYKRPHSKTLEASLARESRIGVKAKLYTLLKVGICGRLGIWHGSCGLNMRRKKIYGERFNEKIVIAGSVATCNLMRLFHPAGRDSQRHRVNVNLFMAFTIGGSSCLPSKSRWVLYPAKCRKCQ